MRSNQNREETTGYLSQLSAHVSYFGQYRDGNDDTQGMVQLITCRQLGIRL